MLFFLSLDGIAQRMDTQRIFRGQNGIEEIRVVSPISNSSAGLQVGFQLPNGLYSGAFPMEFVGSYLLDGVSQVNEWVYKPNANVTAESGNLSISFAIVKQADNNYIVETTNEVIITVEQSAIASEGYDATTNEVTELRDLLTLYYNQNNELITAQTQLSYFNPISISGAVNVGSLATVNTNNFNRVPLVGEKFYALLTSTTGLSIYSNETYMAIMEYGSYADGNNVKVLSYVTTTGFQGTQVYKVADNEVGDVAPDTLPISFNLTSYKKTSNFQRDVAVGDYLIYNYTTANAQGQRFILCDVAGILNGITCRALFWYDGARGEKGARGDNGTDGADGLPSLTYKRVYVSSTPINIDDNLTLAVADLNRMPIVGDVITLIGEQRNTLNEVLASYSIIAQATVVGETNSTFKVLDVVSIAGQTGKNALFGTGTSESAPQEAELVAWNISAFNRVPLVGEEGTFVVTVGAVDYFSTVRIISVSNGYANIQYTQTSRMTGENGEVALVGYTNTKTTEPVYDASDAISVSAFNRIPIVGDTGIFIVEIDSNKYITTVRIIGVANNFATYVYESVSLLNTPSGSQIFVSNPDSVGDIAPEALSNFSTKYEKTSAEQSDARIGDFIIYYYSTPNSRGQDHVFGTIDSIINNEMVDCIPICWLTGKNGINGTNGTDGVGVLSIIQTTTSNDDGGENIITVTLTNGTTSQFVIKNGNKGSDGGLRLIKSPTELGLTTPCATIDVVNAINAQSITNVCVLISNDNFNIISDTPTGYGTLEIMSATKPIRMSIKFTKEQSAGINNTTVFIGAYVRTVTPNTVEWKEVAFVNNISNPNLLINGDFRVKQRGKDVYNTGGYTVDRWLLAKLASVTSYGTVAVEDDGLLLTAGTTNGTLYLRQALAEEDWKPLIGKTLTCTVNASNVSGSCIVGKYGASGIALKNGLNTISITFADTDTLKSIQLYCNANASCKINWVKLELGSVATPYSPRPYAEELALCQRYGIELNLLKKQYATIGFAYAISTSAAYCVLSLPTTLRTSSATIIADSNWQLRFASGLAVDISSFTNAGAVGTNAMRLDITIDGTLLNVGDVYQVRAAINDASLFIDAEI